jgi:8-oxo-dGTP pyrophosphatase MutT (NUDIX family)
VINLDRLTELEIQQRLTNVQDEDTEDGFLSAFLPDAPRPAAVLVPFLRAPLDDSGKIGWHILLTKRSEKLVEHSGQVAFPGGRSDPEDNSPEATALRESQEEIGLDPLSVHILGRLDSLLTITNYRIFPVAGVIPWPFNIQLASGEVDRVFTIPLNWLAQPSHHEVRQRVVPPPYSLHFGSESHPIIYFQPYDGEILWGVSAEITMRLLKALNR